MKIIILAHLRTRSSFLLSALCNRFALENKWEPYEAIFRNVTNRGFRKEPEIIWPIYQEETTKFTAELMEQDNFVVKLFSHAFFNSNIIEWACMKNKPFNLEKNDILDLENNFQISNYDKIYFLTRHDYINNVCSYLFGNAITKLLWFEKEKNAIKMYDRPMFLHYDKLSLQSMVIKNMLMPVYEQKLIDTKLPYTKLDYEDIPNYVETELLGAKSDFVESKYNYKNLIKNYDQLVNEIEEQRLRFTPIVNSLFT